MVIFGLISLNILILNIRLWITRNLRNHHGKIRLGLTMGSIAALSLFVYPQLLTLINLAQYRTGLISQELSIWGIALFIGYLLITLLINSFITKHITPQRQLLLQTSLFLIILVVMYLTFGRIALPATVIYYLLVAGSEEFLKYLSSRKLQDMQGYASSDIIVYALIIALGFAFFENIVYLLQAITIRGDLLGKIAKGSTLLFTRGVISFLVHLLFTGTLALFAVYAQQNKNLTWLIAGIIVSITLHLSYNLFLVSNKGFLILIYLLIGYIFLSRLLFKSERLYIIK